MRHLMREIQCVKPNYNLRAWRIMTHDVDARLLCGRWDEVRACARSRYHFRPAASLGIISPARSTK